MKRRDLIRHVEANGCRLEREGGRHTIVVNDANNRSVPIPRHREIPDVFVRGICKQLGIPRP
jgi:predicted RNA binding protein YcfA (HicA-like mRNA interferase family)